MQRHCCWAARPRTDGLIALHSLPVCVCAHMCPFAHNQMLSRWLAESILSFAITVAGVLL